MPHPSVTAPNPATACDNPGGHALMGLARLMTLAFRATDLGPLAQQMIGRASADADDGNALMDLSTILQLQGIRDVGLATLDEALQTQRIYHLPPKRAAGVRLLAIMAPGDLMANAPLPFLFEDADVDLTMLYLCPGEPVPQDLPPHDVVFIAASESAPNEDLLHALAHATGTWPRPVINRPERVLRTARDAAGRLLRDAPGLVMPETVRQSRAALQWLLAGHCTLADVLPGADYPLIIRPLDSHAGHGLAKVDDPQALQSYLAQASEGDFYISRFVDYSGTDGQFRKYRVVLVDGRPFAGHMGVSAHWMIHYLNAGMTESAAKRAEEEHFMTSFDTGFAQRHREALQTLADRFGLEYLVIDCAETPQGELLVFEVDPGAVVHSMDPPELFPYKAVHMQKVFKAFRALLQRMAHHKA